jgi:hypothetical protein
VAENPDDLEATLAGKSAAPKVPEPAKKDAASLLGKAGQLFGKRGA